MSRKKLKSNQKPNTKKCSTEELVRQAEKDLAEQRYKKAIETYKQLIKHEPRQAWLDALSVAYLERSKELAHKGMYKEAVALWENRAQICSCRQDLEFYLIWLIKAHCYQRAVRLFTETDDTFKCSVAGRTIEALIAGLLMTGHDELKDHLSVETPLRQQLDIIQSAIHAYCNGEDSTAKSQLKKIPFRSPYKDLRQILQALLEGAQAPAKTQMLVEKVAKTSPFKLFADLISTAFHNGREFYEALPNLQPPAVDLITCLRGLDGGQKKLVQQLKKQSIKNLTPKTMLRFVVDHAQYLDRNAAQRFCLQLLPGYPDGCTLYAKQFGPLAAADRYRILALKHEQQGSLDLALDYWTQCADQLSNKNSVKGSEKSSDHCDNPSDQQDERLKAALVLRHIAERHPPASQIVGSRDPGLDALTQSLALDPHDKHTYLEVLQRLRRQGQTKQHDRWLERAVKHLPEDTDILLTAATAGYRRAAYKKATQYAQTIVKLDPINSAARKLLISCYLGYARKQAIAGKYHLAEKELVAAVTHVRDQDQQGAIELTQGLIALRAGDQHQAKVYLSTGYLNTGGSLCSDLRLFVDGHRLKIAKAILLKQAKELRVINKKSINPSNKEELLRFANLLQRYHTDDIKFLLDILAMLRKPLQQAAKQNFTEQEFKVICQTFQAIKANAFLKMYADAALKQWRECPIFVYYQIMAKVGGAHYALNRTDQNRLVRASNRAAQEQDFATVSQIDGYLDQCMPAPFSEHGVPPGFERAMMDLMGEIGEDGLNEMLDILESGGPFPSPPRSPRKRMPHKPNKNQQESRKGPYPTLEDLF